MEKKRVGRYSQEFRRAVVERMKGCINITELAKELGVERKSMYLWREQLDPESVIKRKTGPPGKSRAAELEQEVTRLKRVLADKTLELDFFKGALQKVEERRRQSKSSGGKTSTTTSGK
ncbi:MAG TPA: transposase [Pyrinomonadaceae bacterium]|nr:transposase [Pyrinomonadaceae bacterium]